MPVFDIIQIRNTFASWLGVMLRVDSLSGKIAQTHLATMSLNAKFDWLSFIFTRRENAPVKVILMFSQ